ncbi:MAG TPA: hypothetical protein VI168_01955 [Croceibacterium sp.]
MPAIRARPLPPDSLLARHSRAGDHTDCYACEVPGAVPLAALVEAFYCSRGFLPERLLLYLIGRGASPADARRLARGESEVFAAWRVEARMAEELLLQDFQERTRSWLAVEPLGEGGTRLCFGSGVAWRGRGDAPFKALMGFHAAYSRVLLRAAAAGIGRASARR